MQAASSENAVTGQWSEIVTPRYLYATVTVSLGIVIFAFNAFLVSTALPSAVFALGGAGLLAWSMGLYLIFSIASGVCAARVMQRYGARRMFNVAAIVFMAGTLLAGLAPSMPVLLAGRSLQGFAAGLIESGCYVLIPRLFPSRLIPKVFGVEAVAWALSAFGGPLLAGYLAEAVSWRVALLSALPLVVAFWVLIPFVVKRDESPVPGGGGLAIFRLSLVTAGMLLVTLAGIVESVAGRGLMLAVAIGLLAVAAGALPHIARRIVPAEAFRVNQPLGLGYWVALLMPVAEAPVAIYLVYVLQQVWGYAPLAAGGVNAIMALSWSATQFLVATACGPHRRLTLIWLGPLLLAAGLFALAVALNISSLMLLILAQIAIGAGFGVNWAALSQTMMETAAPAERDSTSALLPAVMAAGYGLGAAFFGVVANSLGFATAAGDGLLSVMLAVFVTAGAAALVSLAAAGRMVLLLRRA